jgi:hypothetical protein
MKTFHDLGLSALALACLCCACVSAQRHEGKQLDDKQAKELGAEGASDFGIQWEGRLVGAGDHGVVAVTDGVTTLTTRPGARIFIVHNRKEFPPSEQTAFKGSDAELKSVGMRFLRAAGAREDEVAEVRVLQQFTQSGQAEPGGREVRVQPAQESYRTLMISRRVAGVDVLPSHLMLNADSAGSAAFMELAWPDFSREVLDRALRYKKLVEDRRFAAPALEGGEVEDVRAVVLHSPAVGFYNDATAAIRVIYRPNARQVGQKAVRYVDERGEDVKLPRDVDRPHEAPARRGESSKQP